MSSKISWLVKGYPYSVHRENPTPADNNYIPQHIWINTATEAAYILTSVIDGVAAWAVRAPDYIKNEGTEYQVNVIEQIATGTQSTGAPQGTSHIQGTDQELDAGGSNAVSAQQAKSAAQTAQNGEITLTPKSSPLSGAEGTMFYCSDDNHVYVGVE